MTFLENFYSDFIPFFLVAVMAAMGLSLRVRDLYAVAAKPAAILAGLTAQLIMLPAIAIGLGFLFDSPAVIAAGAIIIAACPGGVTSNVYAFASGADVALSVALTAVASTITIFTIPFLTLLALELYMNQSEIPALPILSMIIGLAKFTVVPVAAGMTLRALWPDLAARLIEPLRKITLVSLLVVITLGTITTWDTISENFVDAGALIATLNVSAMMLGYGLGVILRLPFTQVASITFEVGVQNLSLALFVSLTFLKSPDLAVSTLVYGLVMKITALAFVWFVRRRLVTHSAAAEN